MRGGRRGHPLRGQRPDAARGREDPDGDERDKDVANAIRYAVDNGASIINMSFGKGYSPDKKYVDNAVKYAAEHDVLLVHAAGNDAENNDNSPNFPNANYIEPVKKGFLRKKEKSAPNWLEIGALSWRPGERLVVDEMGGDAGLGGGFQAQGIRPVADHGGDVDR